MVLVLSVNVNGLRNIKKWQNSFNWFTRHKLNIALVQETHCENEETKTDWIKDWKGDSLWSYGTNLSKGVAFLFNEHARLKIISHKIYEEGRMLSLKTEINELKLQILNIYAPNIPTDRKRFKKITETIDETYVHIIAGHFNCVMDGRFDRNPHFVTGTKVTLKWMN